MKKIIKTLLTIVNCFMFKIQYKKGLYIGFGAKLVGGGCPKTLKQQPCDI